jgi:uncharacterized protein involved in outer membrane biogenesis
MKLIMKLVVLLVVVLVVLVLARNVVVKAAAENGVRAVTGMPLSIGKLDISFAKTLVDIENLVVKNPAGFHDTTLVDIPKILVDFELFSFIKGKAHIEKIEFDMSQFTVVKNEKGELNLDRLKALQGTQKPSAQKPQQEPQPPSKPMPIKIDEMRLKIGKVVYIDYSSGQPVTKEFNINFDQSFQDISDLQSVARLIVLKAMMSSGISNLVNFDINGLQSAVTDSLNASAKTATEAAAKSLDALKAVAADPSQAGGVLKNTAGAVENTTKELAGGVKSAASSLKKLNPFSKS